MVRVLVELNRAARATFKLCSTAGGYWTSGSQIVPRI
jgi:hypothetical protein